MTPASCIPTIVSAFNRPDKYGSTEKPSQFRPPRGVRPRGPALGPSAIFTSYPCQLTLSLTPVEGQEEEEEEEE